MNRAIFFDKDGVLNPDKGRMGTTRPVEFYPGVGDLLAYFKKKGFKIVVVTNQPIVARGIITERELEEYLERFRTLLLEQNKEAIIDGIYYCPHHPHADIAEYRKNCDCRKPKPEMLIRAAKENNIDLKRSYMVGDRLSDIMAGRLAGCTTIRCLTGRQDEGKIESDLEIPVDLKPDFTVHRILELKDIIT